jgi:glycosyltransferase involved in cell wall biosynthesis
LSQPTVNQYASQVCLFDAVGNETFAIQRVLSDIGVDSEILCDLADTSLHGRVRPWSKNRARASHLTIVHYSHGSKSIQRVFASSEPKVLLYHNITPAKYFRGTHSNLVRASESGREQLAGLANRVEVAVAHSTFSANELRQCGFPRIELVPYVSLETLGQVEPDRDVMDRCRRDGWVNLICVAQVAPHKCIEDCLFVFDYFKRFVFRKSRLFVIGGWAGTEAYLERLRRLVNIMQLSDVVFTGQVSQESLIAYYKSAHAFLCMSEHEGFCVPVLEAMRYEVPVFAYAAAAVPETLRYSGVLFPEKDWPTIAEAIGLLLADQRLRAQVVAEQREQLPYYSRSACQERLRALLASVGIAAVAEDPCRPPKPGYLRGGDPPAARGAS